MDSYCSTFLLLMDIMLEGTPGGLWTLEAIKSYGYPSAGGQGMCRKEGGMVIFWPCLVVSTWNPSLSSSNCNPFPPSTLNFFIKYITLILFTHHSLISATTISCFILFLVLNILSSLQATFLSSIPLNHQ